MSTCPHQGAILRGQQCPSCRGSVTAKILACNLHGECTLFSHPIPGVRQCNSCPDNPEPKAVIPGRAIVTVIMPPASDGAVTVYVTNPNETDPAKARISMTGKSFHEAAALHATYLSGLVKSTPPKP